MTESTSGNWWRWMLRAATESWAWLKRCVDAVRQRATRAPKLATREEKQRRKEIRRQYKLNDTRRAA